MHFSLRAAQAAAGRYGGMENIFSALSGDDQGKVLGELIWLIALLVEQGVACRNLLEDAHETAPTEEEVGILLGMADLYRLKDQVVEAMVAGMSRTVETEEDGEKNGAATRGKKSSRGASTSA